MLEVKTIENVGSCRLVTAASNDVEFLSGKAQIDDGSGQDKHTEE